MELLPKLFTSASRARLLGRLVLAAGQPYYQRELAMAEGVSLGAAVRELDLFRRLRLVESWTYRRRRHYRVRVDHPLFPELKALFLKAALVGSALRNYEILRRQVRVAFVFGSFAKHAEDANSDLDLAVLGPIDGVALTRALEGAGLRLGRELNTKQFTEGEIRRRYRARDSFVREIADGPKIFVIGSEHDLRSILEEARPRKA